MQQVTRLRALLRDDAGQDLIEYALLAGLLALATVTATQAAGETIATAFWERIAGMLDALPIG
jgi:Flp pilus assembly pilin Flp